MKIHVDTDFAGDTDDACAVALLLGTQGVEITSATTVADPDGWRAGYLAYFLRLAHCDAPVAAGAARSLTTSRTMGDLPDHAAYWGDADVAPNAASSAAAATDLLAASIDAGATIVAIGPYTNLALLEAAIPGMLGRANVVVMGGWITPPRQGLPQWRPDMDWNVQCDTTAAETVYRATGRLTLATLPATLDAHLRQRDLDRLRASGPIGRLLARQALAHADEHDTMALGRAHAELPDDLLNFQYDVVACALALGLDIATLEDQQIHGRSVRVTKQVDGERLNEMWLAAVERADARPPRHT